MKNKNINILIFTQTLESGGAEKQAVMLANIFSESFNVELIVFYGEKTSDRIKSQVKADVNLILLSGNLLKKTIKLYSNLRKSKPFILFNYLLLPNLLGGIIGKLISKSISIGGIRSAILDKKKILPNRFAHNRLNNKTVFNNYSGYIRYTEMGFRKERAIVIPNAIELPKKEVLRRENEMPNVLSVGRFEEVKDYYSALKSIKGLLEFGLKFTYTIIGWGSMEKQIYQWISELEIPDNIIKVIINPLNIEKYYLEADIYFQTSLFEGLSNTVLEAMSYSLPLVITDVGDNSRLVINNGFLITPKDTESIIKSISLLINDYEKRIEFGRNSYQIVKENYSIDAMRSNYLALIKQLTNEA